MKLNKEIHPNDLASAIKNFIFYLNLFKERINDLNVFPVPDGDTGTNMHLTLKDLDKIIETPTRLPDFLKDIAHTTLMGARGNSGVILSQFFKALLNSYEKNGSLTINSFSETFLIAAKITRESLPNPVEGTMLTIYDDIGKVIKEKKEKVDNFSELLKIIADTSIESVKETPNKLQILKDAGVVDSGALGLAIMLNSWYFSIDKDVSIEIQLEKAYEKMIEGMSRKVSESFLSNNEELEWGNCTVFTIKGSALDINKERKKIPNFGESAVITGDKNLLKIHIHVEETESILNYAKSLGEVENLFIQNMDEQTRNIQNNQLDNDESDNLDVETALISVCEGNGIVNSFLDAGMGGVKIVIGGGTNNPSVKEILDVVSKIKSYNIIVLPNDSNVIPVVKEVINMNLDKNLSMLETTSIQEGIVATFNYDSDLNYDINIKNMEEAVESSEYASITKATRDVTIKGIRINKNDYMVFKNSKINGSYKNLDHALHEIIADLYSRKDLITLFVGDQSIKDNYNDIEEKLNNDFESKEIVILDGNQKYYNYLLLAE